MHRNWRWCHLAFAVAALALAALAWRVHHFESDGYLYARMSLQDRGVSPAAADARATAFYQQHLSADEAARLPATGTFAAQLRLYRARVLAPALAAALWPRFGFWSPVVLSFAAYAAALVLAYVLLIDVIGPPLGPVIALPLAVLFGVEARAYVNDGGDLLALACCLAFLLAAVRHLRGSDEALFVAAVALVALIFVRPVLYIPLGATVAAVLAPASPHERARGVLLLAITLVVTGVVLVGTVVGFFPSLHEQLAFVYARKTEIHGPQGAFWPFYARVVAETAAGYAKHLVTGGAVVLLALAGVWCAQTWRSPVTRLLAGAALLSLAGIMANPTTYLPDTERVVSLPASLPVLVGAGSALALGLRAGWPPRAIAAWRRTAFQRFG